MMNISGVGHLGRNPEQKTSASGVSWVEFSIASNQGFGDKKTTGWYNCKIWGRMGETAMQYLAKGSKVFVSGELTQNKYTGRDGAEKLSMDINVHGLEFLGAKGDGQQQEQQTQPQQPAQSSSYSAPQGRTTETTKNGYPVYPVMEYKQVDEFNDDIPF